jgi:hypothetical protein
VVVAVVVAHIGPASSCRLALCSPFPGWQFIALYRRLANTGPLEDFQRLRDIRARGSRGEVVRSPQCREFLRHRRVDQLVKRYPFSFRELTRFFQERRLKPQRKITFPHDIAPNRSIVAPGNKTSIPNRSVAGQKSRRLNVTIASGWHRPWCTPEPKTLSAMNGLVHRSNQSRYSITSTALVLCGNGKIVAW